MARTPVRMSPAAATHDRQGAPKAKVSNRHAGKRHGKRKGRK